MPIPRFSLFPSLATFLLCFGMASSAFAAPMITLTKTDGQATVAPNQKLTYSIVVGNTTGRPKTIVVQDALPSMVQFMSASHGGRFVRATKMVTWTLRVPAQGSTTVTVTVLVPGTVKNGTVITNNAFAQGIRASDSTTVTVASSSSSSSSSSAAAAKLEIAHLATGTTDVAVKNQKNVNLLRFRAHNATAGDILATRFIFTDAAGSLLNGQNYTLWVDTDNNTIVDTVVQKNVSPAAGRVTFGQLVGGGYVVPTTSDPVFEVHTDIAASLTNSTLQLQFSTADTYVEAENNANGQSLSGIQTNGTCPVATCDIAVTTNTSMLWNLWSQGNLYVSQDTTPLRSRQLIGGALGETVLRLKFRAEGEGVDVYDLQFSQLNGTTIQSIDRLELYKVGELTPFAAATVAGCGTDITPPQSFCAKMQSQQLIVPKENDVIVLVRPRLKTDTDGAVSGDAFQLYVSPTAVINNATGEGAVKARGMHSSNNLIANNGNTTGDGEVFIGRTAPATTNQQITGSPNVVVLSKIMTIANANPDANGSSIPVGISDVGQFKFSAVSHSNSKNGLNKVALNYLYFNVNAVNTVIDGSTLKFYNKANSTVTTTCNPMLSDGTLLAGSITADAFIVKCGALTSTIVNTAIDQGSDQTFVLQMNVLNPKELNTQSSTLQVMLTNFDSISLTTLGPSATESHFEWIDTDTTQTPFRWVEYPDTTVKSTSYQG